ncbi:hypothetical protein DAMA08_002850 [Martiniozyma asiatica (nom. inval.)]|nr:hypothetical protein DAMA08_002850 [Martiniozyma asiatica]
MFFFTSNKFDPVKFEKNLQTLSTKISSNEKYLRQLRASRQHYSVQLPIYLSAIYVGYFSYLYFIKSTSNGLKGILNIKNVGYLIGLIVIMASFYILVLRWFSFLIGRRESNADSLKEKHSEILSQLKESTNFDKTKDLLVRYGDGEDIAEMEKQIDEIKAKKEQYKAILQDAQSKRDAKKLIMEDLKQSEDKGSGYYQMMINALLGDDETSPDSRYALICSNCGQHNGLAPPQKLPHEVRYICPRCGVVNEPVDKENEDCGNDNDNDNGKKQQYPEDSQ